MTSKQRDEILNLVDELVRDAIGVIDPSAIRDFAGYRSHLRELHDYLAALVDD